MYGITEITVHGTYYAINKDDLLKPQNNISIGQWFKDLSFYILNANKQLVPQGVVGELYVGGEGLAKGYLNRDELTAERFIENSFLTADERACKKNKGEETRVYKSGDLVRWLSDGSLECVGRIDNQVKVRGFRVELSEIETVLNQYPTISNSVVLIHETVSERYLIAYVETASPLADQVFVSELKAHLEKYFPNYMVPSFIMRLTQLPLTVNGKIDKKVLPKPDLAAARNQTYIVPRNAVEQELAKIWEAILEISPIGVLDNFFEIGGHSLMVTKIVSRVNEIFCKNLPISSVFECPTIADFAELLAQNNNKKKTGEASVEIF
jgi:acyl-CoA synthetase (AMP-forming)/AMP-acid ligase II